MENRDFDGVWSLPDDTRNGIGGTAHLAQDEMSLRLFGSFLEVSSFGDLSPDYPAIFGSTADGKLLTLGNCQQTNLRFNSATGAFQTLAPAFALIDAHISEPDQFLFSRADIAFNHLSEWLWQSGFKQDDSSTSTSRYTVTYDFPASVDITTPRGKVSLHYTFRTGGDSIGELRLEQAVSWRIDRDESITVTDWNRLLSRPLQDFLTLATREPNVIEKYLLYSEQLTVEGLSKPHNIPIELVYRQSVSRQSTGRLHPANMLFNYAEVAGELESLLNRWFVASDELDSVFSLFFSVRYRPEMYTEQKFLNYTNAIESYHARRLANPSLRYRLNERLVELLDEIWPVVTGIAGDKTKLCEQVVVTRNYLAHYDSGLKSKAASGARLFWLVELLGIVIEVCLLRELAFPMVRISDCISRDWSYRRLRDEPWDQSPN